MKVGGRPIRTIAVAALTALAVVPASAAAKPGFSVEGPQHWSEFQLPATNGYRIRVSTTDAGKKPYPNIYISASKGPHYGVEYFARGLSAEDGAIKAKLPGVGRIAVRFEQARVTREAVPGNCKGRASLIRHGLFSGKIEIRGEHGYTSVHRHSAQGQITQSFRQVCDQRELGGGGPELGKSPRLEDLLSGRREGRRTLSFSVSRFDFGPKFGEPTSSFSASSSLRRHGVYVVAYVSAESGQPQSFLTSGPAGPLEDASVTPPAPFDGSATFHLDSPTSSSWTGTLSVELPGVGKVALAGAGFWSALCEETTCTKTLPPNVRVGFTASFVSASG
jgi:hypothetical protein